MIVLLSRQYIFYFLEFCHIILSLRGDTMLHLNNRGWGLSVLLAFLIVFFIAIILIGIGASNLGLG